MKFTVLFVALALPAFGQTNKLLQNSSNVNQQDDSIAIKTNLDFSYSQRMEKFRNTCIDGRRSICGKILQVFPGGLVVESGYTNLLREPLTSSWLVSGAVTASRAPNLIEANTPGSACIGIVYLTDLPKSKKLKPKQYDYVIIEGYPAGHFTYTSLEPVQKTVRRFSAQLSKAVESHFQAEPKLPPPAAGVK